MNGIYDFEQYSSPYLDVEMLMKRKAQKRARRMLLLSGIAAILMMVMTILVFAFIAEKNQILFAVLEIGTCIYTIVALMVVGRYIKKGAYLCREL